VFKAVPEPGDEYLLCSLRDDHILPHTFMTEFSRTRDLRRLRCPYCQSPVLEQIYIQERI
jgi:hypothetical protein